MPARVLCELKRVVPLGQMRKLRHGAFPSVTSMRCGRVLPERVVLPRPPETRRMACSQPQGKHVWSLHWPLARAAPSQAPASLCRPGLRLLMTISAWIPLGPRPASRSAGEHAMEGAGVGFWGRCFERSDGTGQLGGCLSVSFRSLLQIIRQRPTKPVFSVLSTFKSHGSSCCLSGL